MSKTITVNACGETIECTYVIGGTRTGCTQLAINGTLRCGLHQECTRIVAGQNQLCGDQCADNAMFCKQHVCAHYPRCEKFAIVANGYCYNHLGSEMLTCKQWAPHRGKCPDVCFPNSEYCRKHVWLAEAPMCNTCGVKRVPPKCRNTGTCHFCNDQSGGPGITSAHVAWMQPHLNIVGLTLGTLTEDALNEVLALNQHLIYHVTVLQKCVEGDYTYLTPPSMGSFGVSPTWSLPLSYSPSLDSASTSSEISITSSPLSENWSITTIDSNEVVIAKPTYAEMAGRKLSN